MYLNLFKCKARICGSFFTLILKHPKFKNTENNGKLSVEKKIKKFLKGTKISLLSKNFKYFLTI